MSERVVSRIQLKINYMGLQINAKVFIYMRLVSSLVLFLITFFLSNYGFVVAPLTTILYYFFIEYFILDLGIKMHTKDLEHQALSFFPLFLIHLNGTRNVKKALYFTTSLINDDLSYEFRRVLNDIDIGKSVEESLKDLNSRMPSGIIRNIITSIIEINRVGVNIDGAIKFQLEILDARERQGIINRLKVIPFKVALVSIVFLFIIIMFLTFIRMYVL